MTLRKLQVTDAPAATILIRVLVGGVFLSEGLQKFLFPDHVGVGRFDRIGFPDPAFWASFVGVFEVLAGTLLILGLLARLAALPLSIIAIVALVTTKIPILRGRDLGVFEVRDLDRYGFWSMLHESRTDLAMLLGSLFLLIVGAGAWSVDAWMEERRRAESRARARRGPVY